MTAPSASSNSRIESASRPRIALWNNFLWAAGWVASAWAAYLVGGAILTPLLTDRRIDYTSAADAHGLQMDLFWAVLLIGIALRIRSKLRSKASAPL